MPRATRFFLPTGNALFEFFLIVLGVLSALAVDSWQQEREEKERLRSHLVSLVGEIDVNLFTIGIIQDRVLPQKIELLGEVIDKLEGSESAPVIDQVFVENLALSTTDAKVWFTRNSYDALLNSDGFKYLKDVELKTYLSGAFNSAQTLLQQPLNSRAGYASTINGLLPSRLMAESHPMRAYVMNDAVAPAYDDKSDYMRLASDLFDNKKLVIRLARNEIAYATGSWYALARMKHDFDFLRSEIMGHPLMAGTEVKPVLQLP